jgi:hypothetical protein
MSWTRRTSVMGQGNSSYIQESRYRLTVGRKQAIGSTPTTELPYRVSGCRNTN